MSCSFCGISGHYISSCNSPIIPNLFERMKTKWIDTLNTIVFRERKSIFIHYLKVSFSLRQLKAVSVKYANGLASWNKLITLNKLYQYFSTRIHLSEELENEDWIEVRRLPTVPDQIPDFAQDLTQPPEEDEEDIMWYIDRTPLHNMSVNGHINMLEAQWLVEEASHHNPINIDWIYTAASNQIIADFAIAIITNNVRRDTQVYQSQPHVYRNLNAEFDSVAKKYKITPILLEEDENSETNDCPICYETVNIKDTIMISCGHKFCGECITQTLQKHTKTENPCCALCRGTINKCSIKNKEVYDKIVEYCNL